MAFPSGHRGTGFAGPRVAPPRGGEGNARGGIAEGASGWFIPQQKSRPRAAPLHRLGDQGFLDAEAASAAALAAAPAASAAAAPVAAPAAAPVAAPAAAPAAAPEAAAAAASAAGAGAGAGTGTTTAAGAGAGAGGGASVLLQAASATAAINVARTSEFFISGFLLWEREKTISGNCQCRQNGRLTDQQGLELLLFSLKLYAEKIHPDNPGGERRATGPVCWKGKRANSSVTIR